MLVINGKIYTADDSAGVIENGFFTVENGVFGKIGAMKNGVPECCGEKEVLDLKGAMVFPGFVDGHTHLGMWEDAMGFEGDDGNEETDPVTPQLRAIDSINPMDRCFEDAWKAGVTTVVTGPGSANAIGGQMLAMKTFGKRIDHMVLRAPLAIKMALGENPKSVYHEKNQAPNTRMATVSLIRENLFKAKRYLEEKRKAEEKPEDYDPPEWDMKCEALIPLLEKKIKAHIHCHRADDIFSAIRIAEEFDFDYVLIHGTEGGMIADELGSMQAKVFFGPVLCDRSKPELKHLDPAAAAELDRNGVEISIITDHSVVPIQYLALCAGIAVAEGLPEEKALKGITIYPARACGLEDRIGSIIPGKDADFSVFRENPFHVVGAKPEWVSVNGRIRLGGQAAEDKK